MVSVDATFQSSDCCPEQPGAWPVLPSVPAGEQRRARGFPPHSDDIQLSHSFLDSGGNPCGLGFGGGVDEQSADIFSLSRGFKLQPLF